MYQNQNLPALSRTAAHAALAGLVLVSPVFSQSGARGMASGWPAGMLVDGGSLPGLRLKAPQDQDSAPPAWTAQPGSTGVPSYDITQLGALAAGEALQIDALSTGNAFLPLLEDGDPQMNGTSWLAVAVSISNSSAGSPGSFYPSGNPGAELAAYYFGQSSGIPADFEGQAVLEATRDHLGLTAHPGHDVTGLDYGIGVNTLTFRTGTAADRLFRHKNFVFFSVTKSWADAHSTLNSFAQTGTGTVAPHAADIYVVEWGTSGWGPIYQYAPYTLLGFGANGDLDALDVDRTSHAVVYSGTPASNLTSQLMAGRLAQSGVPGEWWRHTAWEAAPMPFNDETVRVTTKLGIGDPQSGEEGNVDAVCTFDPENIVVCSDVGIVRRRGNGGAGARMGISLSIADEPGLDRTLQVHVTGWGQASAPTASTLYLFARPTPQGANQPPFEPLYRVFRSPAQDAVSIDWALPAYTGVPYEYRALLYDANGVAARSYVIEILQ